MLLSKLNRWLVKHPCSNIVELRPQPKVSSSPQTHHTPLHPPPPPPPPSNAVTDLKVRDKIECSRQRDQNSESHRYGWGGRERTRMGERWQLWGWRLSCLVTVAGGKEDTKRKRQGRGERKRGICSVFLDEFHCFSTCHICVWRSMGVCHSPCIRVVSFLTIFSITMLFYKYEVFIVV